MPRRWLPRTPPIPWRRSRSRTADVLLDADRAFARDWVERGPGAWAAVWQKRGRKPAPGGDAVGPEAVRASVAPLWDRFGARFRWAPTHAAMLWPDSLGYTVGKWWIDPDSGGAPPDTAHYLTVWQRDGEAWRVALDVGLADAAADPAAHDFDFWRGDWDVAQTIRAVAGADSFDTFQATDRVRALPVGTGLAESWEGDVRFFWTGMSAPAHIRGASLRVYDPKAKTWSIYWIDTLDPAFGEAFTGAFKDSVGTFLHRPATAGAHAARIRFTPHADGTVDWRLASQLDSGEWRTLWTMKFTTAGAGDGA